MSDDRFGDLARTALLPVMEEAPAPPEWEGIPMPLSRPSSVRRGWLVAAAAAIVVLGVGVALALVSRGGGDPAAPTVVTTTTLGADDLQSLLGHPVVQGAVVAFLENEPTPEEYEAMVTAAIAGYDAESFAGATGRDTALVAAREAVAPDEQAQAILDTHPEVVEAYLFVRIDDPMVDLSAAAEALRSFGETVAVWTVLGGDAASSELPADAAALQTWWRARVFAEASGGLGVVSDAELRAVALDFVNQTGRTDVTVDDLRRSVESWCLGNPGDLLVPPDFVAQARRVACIEASNPRWRPAVVEETTHVDPDALSAASIDIASVRSAPVQCCPEPSPILPFAELDAETEASLRRAFAEAARTSDIAPPYLMTAIGRLGDDVLGTIRFPLENEECLVWANDQRDSWNCTRGEGPHLSWQVEDDTMTLTWWSLPDSVSFVDALTLHDAWQRTPGTPVVGGMAIVEIPMRVEGRFLSSLNLDGHTADGAVVAGTGLDADARDLTAPCSADGMEATGEEGLPVAVEGMRDALLDAATSCDFAGLGALATQPYGSYLEWEHGAEGLVDDAPRIDSETGVLRALVLALHMPYEVVEDGDGSAVYVWPAIGADGWAVRSEAVQAEIRAAFGPHLSFFVEGKYCGFRVGITEAGRWEYASTSECDY